MEETELLDRLCAIHDRADVATKLALDALMRDRWGAVLDLPHILPVRD